MYRIGVTAGYMQVLLFSELQDASLECGLTYLLGAGILANFEVDRPPASSCVTLGKLPPLSGPYPSHV